MGAKHDRWLIIGFLAPSMVVFAVVILLPVLMAIRLSLFKLKGFTAPATFVGLDNFISLAQDPVFWSDFQRTIVYTVATVVLQIALGVVVAMVLHETFPGNYLARGTAFIPYIIPTVVVAVTWKWMLTAEIGIIPVMLENFGVGKINFLSTSMAMPTLIFVSTWTWLPFVALVFLAALQTVPEDLTDSAKIDGAGWWDRFSHITIPVLKPVVAMIILLRGLWMFNKFDMAWLMTKGGPLQLTETLPILAYKETFQMSAVGRGTAVAVITLILLLVVVFFYFRALRLEEA